MQTKWAQRFKISRVQAEMGDEQAVSIRAQNKLGLAMRGTMHVLSGGTAKKNTSANLL